MSKPRLLLADDSVAIRKVIELTFADEGYDVTAVGDGDEAMERFVAESPECVIADVNMPGMGGYQLCEMIKGDESTRDIPVILVVGSFEPFDPGEASRVGADHYFTKPFSSLRDVVEKVQQLIAASGYADIVPAGTEDIESLYADSIIEEDDDSDVERRIDEMYMPRAVESSNGTPSVNDLAVYTESEPAAEATPSPDLPEAEQESAASVSPFDGPDAFADESVEMETFLLDAGHLGAPVEADAQEENGESPIRIVDEPEFEPVSSASAALAEPERVSVSFFIDDDEPLDRGEAEIEMPAADAESIPPLVAAKDPGLIRVLEDADDDDELIETVHFEPEPEPEPKPEPELSTAASVDPFAEVADGAIAVDDELSATAAPPQADIETVDEGHVWPPVERAATSATFSPELIEEIVSRVMDRLSEKAVREAAREAVPRIAEKLIREALEEESRHD